VREQDKSFFHFLKKQISIMGASGFPVGQHGVKKLNPLTRKPDSK
jgi:hypothetical protein